MGELTDLAEAIEKAQRAAAARCVELAMEQRDHFGSDEYATDQPVSSFAERFACNQVIDSIMRDFGMSSNEQRILVGKPTHYEEYKASLTQKGQK